MRCDECTTLLLADAYGELSPAEHARCEEHLAVCEACRAEMATLRATQKLLDLVPERHASLDLAALCLRIAARERRHRRAWRYGLVAMGTAAVLLLAFVQWRLRFDVEPGRLVVAWRSASLPAPVDPADAPRATSPTVAIENTATEAKRQAATYRDWDFATAGEGADLYAFAAARRNRGWADARRPTTSDASPPKTSSMNAEIERRSPNYTDLRRAILEEGLFAPVGIPHGA